MKTTRIIASLALFATATALLLPALTITHNGAPPAGEDDDAPCLLTPHTIPRPVESFALQRGDGTVELSSQLQGRMVILNLWATWCPPCIRELPSLERLRLRLADDGFVFVILSVDVDAAAVPPFLASHGLSRLPVYYDEALAVAGVLGVGRLPVTLLLNEDGEEVLRHEGACRWDDGAVEAFLRRLKREERAGARKRRHPEAASQTTPLQTTPLPAPGRAPLAGPFSSTAPDAIPAS